MKIYFAADHAGFKLKQILMKFCKSELGLDIKDLGAYEYNESDDYPEIISRAAIKISEYPETFKAIILGGSGQGEAIVANRFPNVRAVVWYGGNEDIIKLSREHNNANILSIGSRFVDTEQVKNAVKIWLNTDFSDEERHKRRINQIDKTPEVRPRGDN